MAELPNMKMTKNEMPTQDPKVRAHNFEEVALGEDEYFLMGDNRSASFDSRMVDEMFTLEDIRSASGFILFPFDKMKSME